MITLARTYYGTGSFFFSSSLRRCAVVIVVIEIVKIGQNSNKKAPAYIPPLRRMHTFIKPSSEKIL